MIKKIFLPEKIGNRRILSQRIVGLSLTENTVSLALVYAKRNKTIIEKLILEKIKEGSIENYRERASDAIKKLMSGIKSFDQIRICIPASIVVFKELQLQFIDPEKIRMILDYEIESMLPFSLDEAIIDFIITKVDKEQQGSQVLATSIRGQDLQDQLDVYSSADVDPTSITIDLFSLYGLYQQIPSYYSLPDATALVDVGAYSTRVTFLQNGQLRLTRYIQRGFLNILKLICDETQLSIEEIKKRLATQGITNNNDDSVARSIHTHFIFLVNDVQFTLNSFSLKLNFYEGVSKILFSGYVHEIKNFMNFCSDTMQISCEKFNCKKLLENPYIYDKTKNYLNDWSDYSVALGTALPSPQQGIFDLRRKQFAFPRQELIIKQIVTAGCIIFLILTALIVKGYMDTHKLSQHAKKIELREINRFKIEKIFPKNKFPKTPTLVRVVRAGEKIVKEKLELWAPFAQQRIKPLSILLELTKIIDKKKFDVAVREINISPQDEVGPKIEVEGFFKSKTGDHFVDFMGLENRFKESVTLKVIEPIETTPAPEGGVNFSVKLKLKEV